MSMRKGFSFGAAPKPSSMIFNEFKGVDYQSNPVTMDPGRSPSAMNMIISTTGFPEKRTGYKLIKAFGKRINGIFVLKVKDVKKRIVHAGTDLYEWQGNNNKKLISSEMNDDRSVAFQKDKVLYILDGKNYWCYGHDGKYELKKVSEVAFVPTTSFARKPAQGGGAVLDPVNLLTSKRINRFIGNNSDRVYQLDSKDIGEVVKCEKKKSDGEWEEIAKSGYSVDKAKGQVTFASPIGNPPVANTDSVQITFTKVNKDHADKINKCRIYDIYTIGTGDYFFFAGDPDHPNVDYHSKVNDPTYFPDLNYTDLGQDNTAIMAYLKLNGQQIIVKENNRQDVSIFIRDHRIETVRDNQNNVFNNVTTFAIKQGIAGVGGISRYCTVSLRDDSLYLADDGLTSVNTTIVGATMTQNRSYYINPHLTTQDLKEAVAIEYNSKLYIAVGGNCYVADSRQKKYERNAFAESYQYEWCHWDNIPARVWHKDDGLYFGDHLGNVFRFSEADENSTAENFTDNGKAVEAYWDTPFLDFGSLSRLKTMKNLYLVLQPNVRTSCDVIFRTKGVPMRPNKPDRTVDVTRYADLFDWDNIDFGRFSFVSDDAPIVIPTETRIKRFMLLQIRFANPKAEPFGIYKAELTYTVNGKYKG